MLLTHRQTDTDRQTHRHYSYAAWWLWLTGREDRQTDRRDYSVTFHDDDGGFVVISSDEMLNTIDNMCTL